MTIVVKLSWRATVHTCHSSTIVALSSHVVQCLHRNLSTLFRVIDEHVKLPYTSTTTTTTTNVKLHLTTYIGQCQITEILSTSWMCRLFFNHLQDQNFLHPDEEMGPRYFGLERAL